MTRLEFNFILDLNAEVTKQSVRVWVERVVPINLQLGVARWHEMRPSNSIKQGEHIDVKCAAMIVVVNKGKLKGQPL